MIAKMTSKNQLTLPRSITAVLQVCRDANVQMFVELAAVGKADWLVTGDKDLLLVASEFSRPMVRIVTAAGLLGELDGEGTPV